MGKTENEEALQIKISKSLKRKIKRKALENDETLRTFILKAIRQRGVQVPDADLHDRRKPEAN